jgi:hypothetical protein
MPIEVSVTDQNVQVSTSGQTVNASVSGGVGPAGPAGATGATGATGPAGATGATGPAGTTTWAGITDKPATFAPSAHASSHASAGSDPITVGTVSGRFVTTTTGGRLATTQYVTLSQILNGMGTPATSLDTMIADIAAYGNPYTISGSGQMQPPAHVHDTADITSGTMATARLGSGTASASTYLRGDQTWAAISTYTLPAATTSTLGGVIVGSGLSVSSGTVSANVTSVAGKTGAVSLAASDIASGTLATARLAASGTASVSTYLRGDQTWSALTYLPGYSGLADADDWASRVATAGGSVSATTMSAVYRFCQAISSQGLRERFWRLNLFCGTGFTTACLVPLYRGPSLGGTQYGGSTDTASSFISGDYTETGSSAGGLQGDGSSKWISTGLSTSSLPAIDTGHIAAYCVGGFTGSIGGIVTAWNTGFGDPLYLLEANRNSVGLMYYSWGDNYLPANIPGAQGFVMGSRISSTSISGYRNGTSGGTRTTSVTPAATSTQFALFCNKSPTSQSNFFAGRICGYSIGLGMNASEAAAYYRAMQAFQVELGRAVYS